MKRLSQTHVPSGSYYFSHSGPRLLRAFLSSCVGVAVYDPVNDVGGLCHFLLPEPIICCIEGDEAKYASTGLPLFLKELENSGADPGHLRASVAGGAFSGVLSHQDVNLDIGGRTAETVLGILRDRNIVIERSETGGFFTCCLSLNMDNWTVDISPSYPDDTSSHNLHEISVDPDEIENVMDRVQPIPQVALKILRMINEDSANVSDLAQEVKKDQVISGQILKYCNSAIFAGKRGIDSIDDALLIAGQETLARIVTAIAVQNLFIHHNIGYSLSKGGLYHHAIGVACISEKLAVKSGRALPFSAYASGLLHDIGKIVLDQFVAPIAPLFYRNHPGQSGSILVQENMYLKTDHTRIGVRLSEKWSLPDSVKDAICYHHFPDQSTSSSGTVETVALANLLIHMFCAGPNLSRVDMTHFDYLFQKNGFYILDFPEIVDMIPVNVLTANPEMIL